jgi:hypothetical protein
MTRIKILGFLAILSITNIIHADEPPMTWLDTPVMNSALNPRAFFRDDQIWTPVFSTSDTIIEVCWENYSEIVGLEDGQKMMADVIYNANKHWGNLQTDATVTIRGPSLLKFQDIGACNGSGATVNRIRVLVKSDESIALPNGQTVYSPFVRALGKNLHDMPNGVVLDFTFDKKNDTPINPKKNIAYDYCQKWLLFSKRLCAKTLNIHEFGHIIGMSHEHNRDDKPADCKDIDPEIVNGQFIWGNLRIGDYDPWSNMNYCNIWRVWFSGLSDTDEAGLMAFYGRVPWENTELGYSVITIPIVLNGSTKIPNNLILTDQNGDGRYTYCCLGSTRANGKTSVEVSYNTNGDRVLNIPYLLRTTTINGIRTITGIDKMSMTRDSLSNTFKDETNSRTEIYPVTTQP